MGRRLPGDDDVESPSLGEIQVKTAVPQVFNIDLYHLIVPAPCHLSSLLLIMLLSGSGTARHHAGLATWESMVPWGRGHGGH